MTLESHMIAGTVPPSDLHRLELVTAIVKNQRCRDAVRIEMKIEEFKEEYRFLSNFWEAPVMMDGHKYPTVEHAYQAAKTLNEAERATIWQAGSAGRAKRLGATLTMRPDWDEIKVSVMYELLRQKFQIPEFREKLLATGYCPIEEGNMWHDKFWGICHCSKCQGQGGNRLGILIRKVREELR